MGNTKWVLKSSNETNQDDKLGILSELKILDKIKKIANGISKFQKKSKRWKCQIEIQKCKRDQSNENSAI